MIDLLAGGKPWKLLRDDATERQERPVAIGLGEGFPELRERRRRAGPSAGAGGLVGTRCVAFQPSVLSLFPAEPAPIGQLQERRNPNYWSLLRGSTRLYFRGSLFATSGRDTRHSIRPDDPVQRRQQRRVFLDADGPGEHVEQAADVVGRDPVVVAGADPEQLADVGQRRAGLAQVGGLRTAIPSWSRRASPRGRGRRHRRRRRRPRAAPRSPSPAAPSASSAPIRGSLRTRSIRAGSPGGRGPPPLSARYGGAASGCRRRGDAAASGR